MSGRADEHYRRILAALKEDGGFDTGHVASRVGAGSSKRRRSQLMRVDLLRLQALGWVRPMDDQKPICWVRTSAGTMAIEQQIGCSMAEESAP